MLTLQNLRDGCGLDRCEHPDCQTECRSGSHLCWDHHRDAHRDPLTGLQNTAWCSLTDHTHALVLL